MIRIDEIYCNVFLPALQHKKKVGLHWFDPFGSVDFRNICNLPPVDGIADMRLVFWDQEPLYRDLAIKFFDQYMPTYQGPTVLVTSEKQSQDLEWIMSTYGVGSAYYFFHGWAALDWYRGYDHCFLSMPWSQRSFQHRLMCPNNIVGGRRTHRLRLLAEFAQRNLLQGNMISFPARCPHENQNVIDLCQAHGIDLPKDIPLPLVIDSAGNHAQDSHKIDFWAAGNRSFCHVVTETVYESTRIHLTEKTFKPIVMQQPFLLVAAQGSLSYLRSYGFKTFSDLWDETYDDLDDSARISAVAGICEKINRWSSSVLQAAADHAREIVEYNHAWFYGGFQDVLWREINDMIDPWR